MVILDLFANPRRLVNHDISFKRVILIEAFYLDLIRDARCLIFPYRDIQLDLQIHVIINYHLHILLALWAAFLPFYSKCQVPKSLFSIVLCFV